MRDRIRRDELDRLLRADARSPRPNTPRVPGKRSLTDDLPATTGRTARWFELALDQAAASTSHLARAIEVRDGRSAVVAASELTIALRSLKGHLTELPPERVPLEMQRVDDVAAATADLLSRAPNLTTEALRSGLDGDWSRFDAELSTWKQVVQRKADAQAASGVDVSAVASNGVSQATDALPFRDDIQRAFGRHDVSTIRVQVGGDAAVAARTLGARAYTIGERVAFVAPPDLHTAAHEAAHVVQQRAGVHLDGELGHADDVYERAADAAADAVVAGNVAEHLLDGPGGGARLAVQRKEHADLAPALREVARKYAPAAPCFAWKYFKENEARFLVAFASRLAAVTFPADPAFVWMPGGMAVAFREALAPEEPLYDRLPELLAPVDPWAIVDAHRPTVATPDNREDTGPIDWVPIVGDALAIEVVTRIRESVARMVPRFVARLVGQTPVAPTDLVASHPLDHVVARLLCDRRVLVPTPGNPKQPASTARDAFPDGVRFLEDWRWVGETDPTLWNWIEVKAPHDATPEDVAATLWLDPAKSDRASAITAAPPYFRVAANAARTFAAAMAHAPSTLDSLDDANGLALANSSIATDAAIGQASGSQKRDRRGVPLPPRIDELATTLERTHRQLERARDLLAGSELWQLVIPAAKWVETQREHLYSIPDTRLAGLAPVIEGQQEITFEVVGAIHDVIDTVGGAGGLGKDSAPITNVLRRYAAAAGESHLLKSARAELALAERARSEMPLLLLDATLHASRVAVRDLSSATDARLDPATRDAERSIDAYEAQLVDLHARMATGQPIDQSEVGLLAARLKAQTFDTDARLLYIKLSDLQAAMQDAALGMLPQLVRTSEFMTLRRPSCPRCSCSCRRTSSSTGTRTRPTSWPASRRMRPA